MGIPSLSEEVSMSTGSNLAFDLDERMSMVKRTPNIGADTKTMEQYLRDRLFADFVLVGLPTEKEKLRQMQLGENRCMADTLFAFFEETKSDERKRVAKDFCFPCGINMIL